MKREAALPAGVLSIHDVVIFEDGRFPIRQYTNDGEWVEIEFGRRTDNPPGRKKKQPPHPPMRLLPGNLLHVAVPYPHMR